MGKALAGLAVILALAVVGLDQWQVRQGHPSLIWARGAPRGVGPAAVAAPARAASTGSRAPGAAAPAPPGPAGVGRVAVIVDDLGGRRDVFEALREVGRPLSVGVLPDLPLSAWIAREATRAGMEVLLDLPLEPYRYPELDPGPGALTMAMPGEELARRVERHLEAVPGAVGAVSHMGSRLTESRRRMRAVLGPLAARGLFFVDARASNHSVAWEEARAAGLRAARRHVLVDAGASEAGQRQAWAAVRALAARQDVLVLAHGHPLTIRLLREEVMAWEAAGLRLVPVSRLVR